jgi:lactoylglutathione lyase
VRMLHTMIRVADLDRSVVFYTQALGMTLFRREHYPDGRFTLAFVGYGEEASSAAIELTHNWDTHTYSHGNGYGHVAIGVSDIVVACESAQRFGATLIRSAGPMSFTSPQRSDAEVIAFIEDPDGYRIELIHGG